MFKVEPVSRDAIDSWTIASSGLPTRVVNGARHAHIDTVGQLRKKTSQELVALRAIGRLSVKRIHRFLELCNSIEHGTQVFLTLQEVFDLFLDGEEMEVLARRYGLMRSDGKARRNFMTLQEIGNELNLTRERIRQVEEIAIRNLKSKLATVCLQPFYLYVRAFIKSRENVADCVDAMDMDTQSWLTGFNPCSILLLLHDLNPREYTEWHGVFSRYPTDQLKTTEQAVREHLTQAARPVPLVELVDIAKHSGTPWTARALGRLLDHSKGMAGTNDRRYFLYESGTEALLQELMERTPRPAHYRTLTHLFNECLKPSQQKGNGYILKALNTSTTFVKTERGHYDLTLHETALA